MDGPESSTIYNKMGLVYIIALYIAYTLKLHYYLQLDCNMKEKFNQVRLVNLFLVSIERKVSAEIDITAVIENTYE